MESDGIGINILSISSDNFHIVKDNGKSSNQKLYFNQYSILTIMWSVALLPRFKVYHKYRIYQLEDNGKTLLLV